MEFNDSRECLLVRRIRGKEGEGGGGKRDGRDAPSPRENGVLYLRRAATSAEKCSLKSCLGILSRRGTRQITQGQTLRTLRSR